MDSSERSTGSPTSMTNTPEKNSMLSLRFPQKLWKIVNDCQTGAIKWSGDGMSLIIDYPRFQEEYLDDHLGVFKTANMTSFIRQLNLYGFRKKSSSGSSPSTSNETHEFTNPYFLKGRKDLLQKVSRKPGANSRMPTPPKHKTGSSRITKCQQALKAALIQQHKALASGTHQLRKKHGGRKRGPAKEDLIIDLEEEEIDESIDDQCNDSESEHCVKNELNLLTAYWKDAHQECGDYCTGDMAYKEYDDYEDLEKLGIRLMPSDGVENSEYVHPVFMEDNSPDFEMDHVLDSNIPPSVCLPFPEDNVDVEDDAISKAAPPSYSTTSNHADNAFVESIYYKLMSGKTAGKRRSIRNMADVGFLFDSELNPNEECETMVDADYTRAEIRTARDARPMTEEQLVHVPYVEEERPLAYQHEHLYAMEGPCWPYRPESFLMYPSRRQTRSKRLYIM